MSWKDKLFKNPSKTTKYALVLAVLWTVIIIVSLAWNYININKGVQNAAKVSARAQFFKDVIYRHWNAVHGGVYVPISESTKPNPFLTEVNERDIETPAGRKLTLINPAYMTRQIHELGKKTKGLFGHITSLKPINPANSADSWERQALSSFEYGELEFSSIELIKGKSYLRLMRPLITEKTCLKCHAKQGYKKGDIRGGISIMIPMVSYLEIAYKNMIQIGIGHFIFWILGLLGLFFGARWINIDILKQKQIEEEKKKLQEQLIQSQKIEAIGTLAGGIAHDFNNILGVIIGYAELTVDEVLDNDDLMDNLSRIIRATERGKDMIQQILSFSRKSDTEKAPVFIKKVIDEIVKFLRASIPTTIDIKIDIEKELGQVFANGTQITQVIMNLCTNAAYAMKGGGILEISLKSAEITPDSLIGDLNPGKYQLLQVKDSGTGIDKDVLDKIFDPYFTTKKVGEGTGMGLAVTYGIIKTYHGHIDVSSDPGETVFKVYFPLMKIDNIDRIKKVEETIIQGNGESILFVDDEKDLVKLGTKMLIKIGYDVEACNSSGEALEIFKSNPDKYDLLITDKTMPEMTGVKLADKIHKIRPNFPIILCTGFSNGLEESDYKAQGINALILKPINRKKIAEVIRKVLDEKI